MSVKVSVILPVYNASDYLHQCMDSIVGQTLKDIEIICVDDGSTDNSLDILKEYEQKDKRVKVIQQKNAGAEQPETMDYPLRLVSIFLFLILMISLSLICWKRLMKKQKVLMHRL